MAVINIKTRTQSIRSDEFKRRAANRVGFWWLGNSILSGLLACIYRLFLHHWPSIGWWPGFFLGGALFRVGYAYQEVLALLERQNALLEQLLDREG